jgi:hypothetical protein
VGINFGILGRGIVEGSSKEKMTAGKYRIHVVIHHLASTYWVSMTHRYYTIPHIRVIYV